MSQNDSNVRLADIRHIRIFYDPQYYAGHPNRGGIWNFGHGEIVVAHLLKRVNYAKGEGINHDYSRGGVMMHRSLDNGETWPESERGWIWNNDRPVEEVRSWLFDEPKNRAEIALADPNAIIHFGQTWGTAGDRVPGVSRHKPAGSKPGMWIDPILAQDEKGEPVHRLFSFSLRSKDKGRTWENKPTLIAPPPYQENNTAANLGYVRFANGVLGIAATAGNYRNHLIEICFYVSYDDGLNWDCVSRIAGDPEMHYGYTYAGLHLLPDGRLMCCLHRKMMGTNSNVGNYPCVAFSDDGGMRWTEPQYIVRPDRCPWPSLRPRGRFELPLANLIKPGPPQFSNSPAYRSPAGLVTRHGRIVVVFARRKPPYGIGGVVSDDLGQTWSDEFILRDDGCHDDCGYPVITELEDGRIFTAYYLTLADDYGGVRHIAGTFFRFEK